MRQSARCRAGRIACGRKRSEACLASVKTGGIVVRADAKQYAAVPGPACRIGPTPVFDRLPRHFARNALLRLPLGPLAVSPANERDTGRATGRERVWPSG